jgi:hypothetical protein
MMETHEEIQAERSEAGGEGKRIPAISLPEILLLVSAIGPLFP